VPSSTTAVAVLTPFSPLLTASVGSLHDDASTIEFHSIHAADCVLGVPVVIKLHKGISLLEVASDDLAILAKDIFNVTFTCSIGEFTNIHSAAGRRRGRLTTHGG